MKKAQQGLEEVSGEEGSSPQTVIQACYAPVLLITTAAQ